MAGESHRRGLDGREVVGKTWQAVEAERARYADLFDFGPFGYLVTDANGVIREANQAAARMLGLGDASLLGKPFAAFVIAEQRRAFRSRLRALAGGEAADFEVELVPETGPSFCAELTAARARGPLGHLRWMLRDVTELKRSEESILSLNERLEQLVDERTSELERERSLLEAVVSQLPAGIIIADARSGEVLTTNAEVIRILGHEPSLRPDGRYGPYIAHHVDGTPYESEEYPLVRSIGTGEVVGGERMRFTRGDGTAGVVEVYSAPVRGRGGRIVAGVAILQDVTERERREQAEREFVTNAAHELQTPLTAIVSATDVLQGGAKEILEDRDRFLGHIEAACDRLTRLTHALLALARAQSGVESTRREPVPLRSVLDEAAMGLDPAPGVEITVRCPARLAAFADKELLEQAVHNLASNAAKHTTAGRIRLAASATDDSTVVVEVSDTGVGMSPGDAAQAFDRFYRGGGRRDAEGFGIGLAIARQAVEALGGTIRLESRRGGGTIARVTLPLAAR